MRLEIWIPVFSLLILLIGAVIFYYRKNAATTVSLNTIVGAEGKVLSEIDNLSGAVSVKGTEWSARAVNRDTTIKVGATVTVVAVEGVQLIVK